MDNYKLVLNSLQNYVAKKAIVNKSMIKNEFLVKEMDEIQSKIEANDLIVENNKISISEINALRRNAVEILMNKATSEMQKNKINQYLRQITNK
jgi:hypothetical protein